MTSIGLFMACADGQNQWLHAAQMVVIIVDIWKDGAVEGLDQQRTSYCSVHLARHGCKPLESSTTSPNSSALQVYLLQTM